MKKWFLDLFFEEYEQNTWYANFVYYVFILLLVEFVLFILLNLLGIEVIN